jgi:hypothetical protein
VVVNDLLRPERPSEQGPREPGTGGEVSHEKVVLGVFEHHVDRLLLEHDLAHGCKIDIVQFTVELSIGKRSAFRAGNGEQT